MARAVTTQLDGGLGADTLVGGNGNDKYYVDTASDIVDETGTDGTDTVFVSFSYSLAPSATVKGPIENLVLGGTGNINGIGNGLANRITGNSGNNVIIGGIGADTMIGGLGSDTYVVDDAGDVVQEGVAVGTDMVNALVSYTLAAGAHVEVLQTVNYLGTANIDLTGNERAQEIRGNAGNNVIDGGRGGDLMMGFAGNDTYFVFSAGDTIWEVAGQGFDTVKADTRYTLQADAHVEVLETRYAMNFNALNLTGNALNQKIVGNSGNNIINGGGGVDMMHGGLGDDTYVIDNAGDQALDTVNGGQDRVNVLVSYALPTVSAIELLQTANVNGTANINLTGNNYIQAIYGNAGNNIIDGRGGANSMRGYGGNDTYFVDHSGDAIGEVNGGGHRHRQKLRVLLCAGHDRGGRVSAGGRCCRYVEYQPDRQCVHADDHRQQRQQRHQWRARQRRAARQWRTGHFPLRHRSRCDQCRHHPGLQPDRRRDPSGECGLHRARRRHTKRSGLRQQRDGPGDDERSSHHLQHGDG